jgi:quercetin dioxygenase-like cupin family protein
MAFGVGAAIVISMESRSPPSFRFGAARQGRAEALRAEAEAVAKAGSAQRGGPIDAAQARREMQRVPQFDNERAIAWKSIIPPHTESTFHRHDRFRTVIGVAGGDLKIVTDKGETTVVHYETGKAYWQAPMPPGVMHKDRNDTDKTIELVVVELK